MYTIKKRWVYGYAILPCFKVKTLESGGGEAELICNPILATIFELFFAPFYDGRIRVVKIVEE